MNEDFKFEQLSKTESDCRRTAAILCYLSRLSLVWLPLCCVYLVFYAVEASV